MSFSDLSQELAMKLQNNDPEQMLALLKVWSFKPNYSEKNALLIFSQLQRPPVSLGSKKFWENLGYSIKSNEKPVTIWIPVEQKDNETSEKEFVLRNRFDVTQTSGSVPYMFKLNDVLKNICNLYRISVRIDNSKTSFVTIDNSHGRSLVVNPDLSSDALNDIVPFIIKEKITESHAKESVNAASAMLIYRTTGNDNPLKALIQSKEITFATRLRDRAAYSWIHQEFDKWFPGLGKIPDKTTDVNVDAQEPSTTLEM